MNTAIVYLTAPSFDKLDKAMTTELALLIYSIAFGVAVVSLAATVCSMEPGYRHTFVVSKTGKQYWVSDLIGQGLQSSHVTSSSSTAERPPPHTYMHPPYNPLTQRERWVTDVLHDSWQTVEQ